MRRRATVGAAIAVLSLTTPGISQTPPSQDSTSRAIDRVFNAWRDTHGPGCAVGVARNGNVLFERGYGMANLETDTPISPSSIFHVASVSKQFTAMAIMLLEKDGRLSVNDNIRKYVPEIPDYGTPITIRHLLNHTSGLRDQWSLLALARGRFEENRITEADVMDILPRQKALNFTPGSEYLYSNSGFTVLAVIVKRVSGKSLRDFADERIFKPLGMTATHFHDDYTMLVRGRTSAYVPRGNTWAVSIPNFDTYGATSLYTTVGDLLKWEANFDAPKVGDRALFARMEAPTILTNGDTSTYGFGLVTGRYRGARVVEHNGADAGYRSYVGRLPESGLGVAVLCNAATTNTSALARGVVDVFLGASLARVDAPVLPQGIALSTESIQRHVGVYIQPTTQLIVQLSARDGKLMLGGNGGQALIPLAEGRFRVPNAAAELVFTSDDPHAGFERRPLPGGRPAPFEWRQAVTPTRTLLAEYAGRYVSDELGGSVYTIAATDSTITLRTGTEDPTHARLVFSDTFLADGYTIQFMWSRGRVTGFTVTDGRMRRVWFERR